MATNRREGSEIANKAQLCTVYSTYSRAQWRRQLMTIPPLLEWSSSLPPPKKKMPARLFSLLGLRQGGLFCFVKRDFRVLFCVLRTRYTILPIHTDPSPRRAFRACRRHDVQTCLFCMLKKILALFFPGVKNMTFRLIVCDA